MVKLFLNRKPRNLTIQFFEIGFLIKKNLPERKGVFNPQDYL